MDFISYIEMPNKEIRFLTKSMIRNTPRGKELTRYVRVIGEILPCFGHTRDHGAIEYYYDMKPRQGKHLECTDFSSPDNFPKVIADALKAGDMETTDVAMPEGLLNKEASEAWSNNEEAWELFKDPKNRTEQWR